MTTLFQFNSAALDVFSGEGFADRLSGLGELIELEIRDALAREAPGQVYEIAWDEDGIVISLSEEQFEAEYGTPDQPFKPAVRTALLRATESIRMRTVLHE